jgi:hypothetical protein
MERTERYDPEDLEQLMLERGFDELLEEERAYAMRHLAGRAEYERMRALLLHVREEAGQAPEPEAGTWVREQVLQAFRSQREPRWRIWLNAVPGLLFPPGPASPWRPALALGAVAVISASAWLLLKEPELAPPSLAELHEPRQAPTAAGPTDPADSMPGSAQEESVLSEAPLTSKGMEAKATDAAAPAPPPSMADQGRMQTEASTTSGLAANALDEPQAAQETAATTMAQAEAPPALVPVPAETEDAYLAQEKTTARKESRAATADDSGPVDELPLNLLQAVW